MNDSIVKRSILCVWNGVYNLTIDIKDWCYLLKDRVYILFYKPPKVMSIQESIDFVVEKNLSVSRFGDGEIKLIAGKNLPFQTCNPELRHKLVQVLSSNEKNIMVCLPDIFNGLSDYMPDAQEHWKKHLAYFRSEWYRHINTQLYGNAFLSRCYMGYSDKSNSGGFFNALRKIWNETCC